MKRVLVNIAAILSAVVLGFGGWLFFVYADIFIFGHKSGSRGMISVVLGMIFSALMVTLDVIYLRKNKLKAVAGIITVIYSVVFIYFIYLIMTFGGFNILFNNKPSPHHSLTDGERSPLAEY